MALHIAPRGWDHAGWIDRFYPDDLPPEWRLTFFCNEFEAVLVPEAQWQAAGPSRLAEWRKECGERNRLFLEGEPATEGIASAAEALGAAFGGMVPAAGEAGQGARGQLVTVARWSQGPGNLRGLRGVIEALAAAGGDGLLVIEGDPPCLDTVRAARTIAELLGLSS